MKYEVNVNEKALTQYFESNRDKYLIPAKCKADVVRFNAPRRRLTFLPIIKILSNARFSIGNRLKIIRKSPVEKKTTALNNVRKAILLLGW